MVRQATVVAYQAKIQFRKQFTTSVGAVIFSNRLLLIKQRYNFESNSQPSAVSVTGRDGCCLSSKDTISKAIHNVMAIACVGIAVVAYQAKIQFRKQFTTELSNVTDTFSCCLSSKDTISKAIHNALSSEALAAVLLLIKQRYNFESNSQREYDQNHYDIVVAYQAKIQFRKQFTTVFISA